MKKNPVLIGFIALLALVSAFCICGWIFLSPAPLVLQGEVEAAEVRVAGKVPGRILEFYIYEGSHVEKGDTLLKLDSPELNAKMMQAKAAVSAAEAQNKKAMVGTRREQIAAAYELWQKALIGVDITEKSYNRVKKLYEREVATAQQYDEVEAQYKAALSTAKAAESQYQMALNGAQAEDKAAAQAMVERAEGAMAEVEAYMAEVTLTAPISGDIASVYPKTGELIGTGTPILSIIDFSQSWITFNIREDLLPGIVIGKQILVDIPALALKEVPLEINYIKALGSYATWKSTKASTTYDTKTFEVRAVPTQPIEDLRPGMSVLYRMQE